MTKEYIVKVTSNVLPNAFSWQELIRCKDCMHYDQGDERHIYNPGTGSCIIQGVYCVDNWFCAGGERKEQK